MLSKNRGIFEKRNYDLLMKIVEISIFSDEFLVTLEITFNLFSVSML